MSIPIYGSDEYNSLPEGDPARHEAMRRAAECWRLSGTNEAISAMLEAELAHAQDYALWAIRRLSNDVSEGMQR